MSNTQCNEKGKRCMLLEKILLNDKGQITTAMQTVEKVKKGKRSIDLRLIVGYKAGKKEPFYVLNVCPFCEGRLYEAAA